VSNKLASSAIVLSKHYYADADAIVTLFTSDYGKLSAVAKGIKKPSSRKRGNLESASLIRFSAVQTKNLPILTEVESLNNFMDIRSDLSKMSLAYYLLELVNKTSMDEEENNELFNLLKQYLEELNTGRASQKRRLRYAKKILSVQGFWDNDKDLADLDTAIESLIERKINSVRIAQKMLY